MACKKCVNCLWYYDFNMLTGISQKP